MKASGFLIVLASLLSLNALSSDHHDQFTSSVASSLHALYAPASSSLIDDDGIIDQDEDDPFFTTGLPGGTCFHFIHNSSEFAVADSSGPAISHSSLYLIGRDLRI